jgi:hypothetical protein
MMAPPGTTRFLNFHCSFNFTNLASVCPWFYEPLSLERSRIIQRTPHRRGDGVAAPTVAFG